VTKELNQQKLRLTPDIESKTLEDGTRLLKQTQRAEYAALTSEQMNILDMFNGDRTVQDILHSVLRDQQQPGIRIFYDLVFHAMDKGFLVPTDAPRPVEQPEVLTGTRWFIGLGFVPALVFFLLIVPAGFASLVRSEPLIPQTVTDWVLVLALASVTLSLSGALAGCALAGFGRVTYAPKIRWNLILPVFSVDARDAFMGGKRCQETVALLQLALIFASITISPVEESPAPDGFTGIE